MGNNGSNSKSQEKSSELAVQYTPDVQYPPSALGYNAKRGCTDLFGWLLYFVCFSVMMLVAVTAFDQGDPDRLIYGIDREGNLCGKHTISNNGTDVTPKVTLMRNGTLLTWSDLDVIVFPIPTPEVCSKQIVASHSSNAPTCEDLLRDALKLGVCWDSCPSAGDKITWYDGSNKVEFTVALDTKKTVNRCIPSDPTELMGDVAEIFGIAGTLTAGFAEMREALHVIGICAGICVLICFLWLFILRRTVKPTVFVSLIVLFLGTCVAVYICFSNYKRSDGGYTEKMWLVLFIGTGGFLIIYVLMCCFFFKNINVACDTIEEASKIPIKIKTMAVVPPVITLLLIPMAAFHVGVALFIETIGDIDENEVISYINITDSEAMNEFYNETDKYLPDAQDALNDTMALANMVVVRFLKEKDWQTYTHLYNLFMFLWSMGLINAVGYLTLALCAVFWYWSVPGDHKQPQGGVLKALYITLRYHLGTLMIGTFIIAVLQLIRFVLAKFENKMRKVSDNAGARCVVSCVSCCLACFERLIKFINKNAYIMTAICGDNFCRGARRAIFLLLRHAWSVIAVNFIADWVMFFGKLQVVTATVAVGWAMLTQLNMAGDDKQTEDCIITLIVIAVIAYVIASIFVAVFSVCVDVVLLSFCYDLDVNNGKDKPYYLPKDLQKSLGHKNQNPTVYEANAAQEMRAHTQQPNFNDPRAFTPPPGKTGNTPLERPLIYNA